jgi:hypothetical protein
MSKYKIAKSGKCLATISVADARRVADSLGIDFRKKETQYKLSDFRRGMKIELEHGKCLEGKPSPITNVTNDDLKKTGKIALAHLKEEYRYYDLIVGLPAMEKQLKSMRV